MTLDPHTLWPNVIEGVLISFAIIVGLWGAAWLVAGAIRDTNRRSP